LRSGLYYNGYCGGFLVVFLPLVLPLDLPALLVLLPFFVLFPFFPFFALFPFSPSFVVPATVHPDIAQETVVSSKMDRLFWQPPELPWLP